jgi:NADH-ubiquinone oxidoreductase chain 2
MIFTSILILIVAIALPSFKKDISSILITRISAIIFIYSGALSLNAFYIQSIGSGIGIYSGLFHVTIISQLLDVLLFFLSALILMSWPLITSFYYNKGLNFKTLLTGDITASLSLNKNKNHTKGLQKSLNKTKLNFIGTYTPITEYCLIVLFSSLGSSLLLSSSDLLSMFLSIELQSFSLYILATIYRDYESATAAGLKYFLLGALSSCFILLGAGLIYSFTGLTNFESLYSLISVSLDLNNLINEVNELYTFDGLDLYSVSQSQQIISGVSLGVILIFIGFLFKIGAAPFHSWSPDVYDESPTQVTIWLTIIPKIAILTLLLELNTGLSLVSLVTVPADVANGGIFIDNIINNILNITFNISYVLKMLLLISSLFSLIIGTIVGLAQTRIKRLLAYSTISHLGFILLALAINTEQSVDSFIFYIIQYSLTNLNIFLIILALGFILNKQGSIRKNYSMGLNSINIYLFDFDVRYLYNYKGLLFSNPILSFSFVICLFSMAGIPPLLGFFSKQFVLLAAIESGYWFMAFIAILTSVISASYYLRVVVLLVTPSTESNNITQEAPINNNLVGAPAHTYLQNNNNNEILTNLHSFLISTITLSILLFILKPTILLNSTQLLSLSLFYS